MHSSVEYIAQKNRSVAPVKYQNFKLLKSGLYKMVIGSRDYPERYSIEEIPVIGIPLRDERREKLGMTKIS